MRDLCVRCGKETRYVSTTPVDFRYDYVEGAGQLCDECAGVVDRHPSQLEKDPILPFVAPQTQHNPNVEIEPALRDFAKELGINLDSL